MHAAIHIHMYIHTNNHQMALGSRKKQQTKTAKKIKV